MTTILQRLVGRANGDAPGGLRPRLPSRFEAGLRESGFTETHAEAPAGPAPVERAQADVAVPGRATRSAEPADRPPRLQVPGPETQQSEPPPVPRRREAPRDAALPTRTMTPPAPVPLMPRAEVAGEGPPASVSESAAPRQLAEAEALPQPDRIASLAAPERLLPPEKPARLTEAVAAALGPQPTVAAPDATAEGASPAEPEITIHIGRLDIRSEAPKTANPPRRMAAPRSLPGLSEYLRGGRS